MNVVEIGCGKTAGPFFDNASDYYVVDSSSDAVARSLRYDPRFTPVVADASRLETLETSSIDIVLARNMFGDPNLGMHAQDYIQLLQAGLANTVTRMVDGKKLSIMREAARILIPQGKLIMVEQYTPMEAEDFIDKLHSKKLPLPEDLSMPAPAELRLVTATNYADYHNKRLRPQVWASTRVSTTEEF